MCVKLDLGSFLRKLTISFSKGQQKMLTREKNKCIIFERLTTSGNFRVWIQFPKFSST